MLTTARLRVWASSAMPVIRLNGDRGVILGDIFWQDHPFDTVREIPQSLQAAIARPEGQDRLIQRFWGNYVATFVDEDAKASRVVRAPLGQLPAYRVNDDGIVGIASDVQLLKELSLLEPSIDWDSLAAHLIAPNLRASATCLNGVDEIIGGCGLLIADGVSTPYELWEPWRFTEPDLAGNDLRDLVAMLRSCIDGCVRALSRRTKHAVLGVSGGLDSSIVAAALKAAGTRFSCVTMFTRDPAGDERRYARALASHLGVGLFEVLEEPANVDVTRSDAVHLPRPLARAFAQSGNKANLEVADHQSADTFFSGGGGDNVFCSLQSSAAVADCLFTGQFRQAWRSAADMAQIAECGIWEVAWSGLSRAVNGKRSYRWKPELAFLNPDLASLADAACTPLWNAAPKHALPGKATHIAFLVGILNHIEGYGRERTHAMQWPLLAQPLVELCLRIPSWLWSQGGINRALARRAYADALPRDILERRAKGTPDCFVSELYEANRAVIRDFLCNGLLADQRLIDKRQIAQFIADETLSRDLTYWRIMALTDVEAWLRSQ